MAQLVGSRCVICEREIDSILEGRFCRTCGSPVHKACLNQGNSATRPGHCAACGANLAKRAAPPGRRMPERGSATVSTAIHPAYKILVAVVCLQFIALGVLVGAILALVLLGRVDRSLAGYLAAVLGAILILVELVAFGLYRRHSWSWLAAIALFLLSLPSAALPAAIIGLVALLDPRVSSFFKGKGEGEPSPPQASEIGPRGR